MAYPMLDIVDVSKSVMLPNLCPPAPLYTQVIFESTQNPEKTIYAIYLAESGTLCQSEATHTKHVP